MWIDRKDAGEIGAGHAVTALYEIIPAQGGNEPGVDPLKYQRPATLPRRSGTYPDEWMTVKLRYKQPDAATSRLLTAVVNDDPPVWQKTSENYRFAAAVAAFGLVLRDSPHKGAADLGLVLELAQSARRHDPHGYRREFIELVQRARILPR